MAKMLLADNLKELRTLIDQQHLLYLEFDENPQKIEQRDKLESYIKEFLCLAPHNTKFTYQETANVLHQSASTKINFSAYKAALAWKAIGKYADNLISHPWRKEYRNIKLYCGFYKHEIEENLVGAEQMFEAMGYRHNRQSSLALYGILDPDRITSVSKDAILAYVECQIMKQIWETLSPQYQITWLEILEFRENHISTPDQVISSLTHKYCQRQYQEKAYHRQMQTVDNHVIQPENLYRHNSLGYFNLPQYSGHSYYAALQNRYCSLGIPQHAVSSSTLYAPPGHFYDSSHHMLKPHNTYSINGHHRRSNYPSQINLPNVVYNGCPLESMAYPAPSVVPTGQLIEFDSPPNYNRGEPYFQRTNSSKHKCPEEEFLHLQNVLKNEEPSLSGKAKDDGAGSWENWDYVYRNLENHGYKKNFDSSGELSLKGNQQCRFQNNSSETDIDGIIQTEVSDKIRKINLNKPTQSESSSSKTCSDGNDELKSKTLKEKTKVDIDISRQHSKIKNELQPRKTSSEKIKKESVNAENNSGTNIVYAKVNLSQKKENDPQTVTKENVKSKKLREDIKPLVINSEEEEEKWQCITCTYLNPAGYNICEMCCKSKERGHEINPQPTGGPQCHKCTLVNKPGMNYCSACNAFLKDSPTYI